MAKSKSYFTLRRGSTKSHTFSVVRGKQITKDRVEAPTNPRTLRQQAQRMFMATASAAYAGMKAIVNHSFEGIAYNSPSLAEFCRLNAIAIRENGIQGTKFSMNGYQERSLKIGSYIMSTGSLAKVPVSKAVLPYDDEGPSGGDPLEVFGISMSAPTTNKLLALTAGHVGDLLTVCKIQDITQAGDYQFDFVRLHILTADDDPITMENLSEKVLVESSCAGTPFVGDAVIGIKLTSYAGLLNEGAKCVIASSLFNEEWKRSFAQMEVAPSTLVDPSQNQDAFDTYPVGAARILNGDAIQ